MTVIMKSSELKAYREPLDGVKRLRQVDELALESSG